MSLDTKLNTKVFPVNHPHFPTISWYEKRAQFSSDKVTGALRGLIERAKHRKNTNIDYVLQFPSLGSFVTLPNVFLDHLDKNLDYYIRQSLNGLQPGISGDAKQGWFVDCLVASIPRVAHTRLCSTRIDFEAVTKYLDEHKRTKQFGYLAKASCTVMYDGQTITERREPAVVIYGSGNTQQRLATKRKLSAAMQQLTDEDFRGLHDRSKYFLEELIYKVIFAATVDSNIPIASAKAKVPQDVLLHFN